MRLACRAPHHSGRSHAHGQCCIGGCCVCPETPLGGFSTRGGSHRGWRPRAEPGPRHPPGIDVAAAHATPTPPADDALSTRNATYHVAVGAGACCGVTPYLSADA